MKFYKGLRMKTQRQHFKGKVYIHVFLLKLKINPSDTVYNRMTVSMGYDHIR